MWNNHIAKALPSINPQPFAAKTILKDQQPLVNPSVSFNATCDIASAATPKIKNNQLIIFPV